MQGACRRKRAHTLLKLNSPLSKQPHPFVLRIRPQWHPRINQIFVGCGSRTGGCVRTFYDPKLSSKGAVSAAARAPRATSADFMRVRWQARCIDALDLLLFAA